MRTFQKLVRNGNSTQVTLPKAMLLHLGWLPGSMITIELREDSSLVVRHFDPHAIQAAQGKPIVQELPEMTR